MKTTIKILWILGALLLLAACDDNQEEQISALQQIIRQQDHELKVQNEQMKQQEELLTKQADKMASLLEPSQHDTDAKAISLLFSAKQLYANDRASSGRVPLAYVYTVAYHLRFPTYQSISQSSEDVYFQQYQQRLYHNFKASEDHYILLEFEPAHETTIVTNHGDQTITATEVLLFIPQEDLRPRLFVQDETGEHYGFVLMSEAQYDFEGLYSLPLKNYQYLQEYGFSL